jgi:hypothetical protein
MPTKFAVDACLGKGTCLFFVIHKKREVPEITGLNSETAKSKKDIQDFDPTKTLMTNKASR